MARATRLALMLIMIVGLVAVTPAAALVGDPATRGKASVITHVKTNRPIVAITVDDFYTGNYQREAAIHILEAANASHAPLTLCPAGSALQSYSHVAPDQALKIKLLVAAGSYELCDHTYSHPVLPATGDAIAQEREILGGQTAIQRFFGKRPSLLFRPPFGSWNQQTQEAAWLAGYNKMILWSIDSGDSEGPEKPAGVLLANVACAVPGDIILTHANRRTSAEALPMIIRMLRAKGLEPVTLSTLLASGTPAYSSNPADMRRLYTCSHPGTGPAVDPSGSTAPVTPRSPLPVPRPARPVTPAVPVQPVLPMPSVPVQPVEPAPEQIAQPPQPNKDPDQHNNPDSRR
ncbi:MAG: hypothetical protein NVS2B7_39940 [Herpetosiphon sp.]